DLEDTEAILANLAPPGPNPPEALVNILALTEAIQEADAANQAKRDLALAAATDAVSRREARVAELKAELKEATEAFEGALAALPALEGSAKAAQAKAEAKPFVDTAPIRDQINKAEATNAAFRHAEQYEDRAARARGLQAKVSAAAQSIDDLDEQKRRALADAKYPIVGLSLNDQGEILYDGIPFAQAAQSEQLRVSMAIGLAANPKLRVCLIRDGSLLDDDSLADLARMAGEADAQVWVERVGEDKRCSVIIENGEVKDATDGSTTEGVAGS
ncbi:MAG TPA: hypothetical protein VMW52_01240, partial [Phycisphaerae bacterium]|nr:hypothetical protein [Phycisphaerae bacterium]